MKRFKIDFAYKRSLRRTLNVRLKNADIFLKTNECESYDNKF